MSTLGKLLLLVLSLCAIMLCAAADERIQDDENEQSIELRTHSGMVLVFVVLIYCISNPSSMDFICIIASQDTFTK